MRTTTQLRQVLAGRGLITAPVSFDALTARLGEAAGFPVAYLGGYAFGCATCITEPLTTMYEMVNGAKNIAEEISVPLIIDGDGGFGEPMHTMRAVRCMIRAGVAGTHIEDQHFPKRAHYQRDYQESVIPLDEMLRKFKMAVRARDEEDPDFVLIGRTDAMRTDGYEEGIARANALFGVGADMLMLFPNDIDEVERAPKDVGGPLVYVNSLGNRVGRPVVNPAQLEDMGYKLVVEAIGPLLIAFRAMRDAYGSLRDRGEIGLEIDEAIGLRKAVEHLVGMEEYYRVEEETLGPMVASGDTRS